MRTEMRRFFGYFVPWVCALAGFNPALAEEVKGLIYEKGQGRKEVLYRYERQERQTEEVLRIDTIYSDSTGKKVVEEETLVEGGKLKNYKLTHNQINARGEVRIEGARAHFSYTRDGKTKTGHEEIQDNFVVGPTIVPYVQKNWAVMMAGNEVKIRYAVPDRAESVGFTFTKMGSGTLNERQVVMVRMKPSSPIIAALVDPLVFTFSADGAHLLELKGRTLPRKLVDGEWKDLDADIIYSGFKFSGFNNGVMKK